MTADQIRRVRRPAVIIGTLILALDLIGLGYAYITQTRRGSMSTVYVVVQRQHSLTTWGILFVVAGVLLPTIFTRRWWLAGLVGIGVGGYAQCFFLVTFIVAFTKHGTGKAGIATNALPMALLVLAFLGTLQEHLGLPGRDLIRLLRRRPARTA